MKVVAVTSEVVRQHGILPEEYERIKKILGREPNFTELGIFSVMWSEHCSYKNSRLELRKFPTTGKNILVKAGEENAGVIDIGDGCAVAFKIESHNHPSAIEPFQGAATGVGGILRDIFTMGARPVALLNSLRFGKIDEETEQAKTNRRLLAGVVSGIAHYGNCIGVPTVGGEVVFDSSYDGNPLVNVFCLGVLKHEDIRRGAAKGTGNPVFYVGAKTGRDGLAGAAFASRDLTEESKEDRPAVQVGDPFLEKLLLEACLELFQHPEAVVGIQDMGAAGLTCSTCETASRAGTGIEIELSKVPQRETGMTPYEIMLSESQERMLIIVNRGHEETVKKIFEKWDIDAAEIGFVTDTGRLVVKENGQVVANIPARPLADEAPLYSREAKEPADLKEKQKLDFGKEIPEPKNLEEILPKMLAAPTIASKKWIFRQYDHMVRTGTAILPGGDAAVVRVPFEKKKDKFLAMTVDCIGRYCALDPFEGAKIAVAEAARNVTMTGARPLAITDNLNFGNPYNPEIFWQLRRCVEGLTDACNAFNLPVTGGNVSLYNQSPKGAVDPTPVVGLVGQIDDEKYITRHYFQKEGDVILLVGGYGDEMGASLYLEEIHGIKKGLPPRMDLEKERKFQNAVRALIYEGVVHSAHDVSDGGLGVALAECCFGKNTGANIELKSSVRKDILLFNESQSRAVITVSANQAKKVIEFLQEQDVEVEHIGNTSEQKLSISFADKTTLSWQVSELKEAYASTLEKWMK
ncbi:MAG: phosphoribosylformylglycinamidine synthase subunit PurL [Verrucomicrobiota bacterium]